MAAYLVFAGGSVACMVLGWITGSWRFLLGTLAFVAGGVIFVIVNDGWMGHGWGDLGVAMSWLQAVLLILGTAGGIALRRHRTTQ